MQTQQQQQPQPHAVPTDAARCVDGVLRARRSVRAYRPEPLPLATVMDILQAAAAAPSNSNTQPWRVHALAGSPLKALGDDLVAASRRGGFPAPAHFPDPLPDELCAHQADFAERYYRTLGIDREDAPARRAQTERNYHFFGAPVGLIFSIDARLQRHSWLDLGLYIQSVMIAAKARGIDTCPQVSFAPFHAVIAPHLQMAPGDITVCGMSMGHGDAEAQVNRMEMPRWHVQAFVRHAGF
ncbi:nitroreductase [Variovorax paradoxus]|uniref:Nitroreductase NfnB n=1 Tax=Variovorax paradoxus TaxID=34073 RepID=A0A679JH33_VARPD|nr:Nitroreductase NfnB [Variovorax paradoxus]